MDLSDKLDSNLKYTLEFAKNNKCQITVLYVVSGLDHSDVLAPSLIVELMTGAEKELKKLLNKKLKQNGTSTDTGGNIQIKTKVLFSYNVPREIADYARKNKFDLIAINSHKKNIMKRLFLGSVAEQVIRISNCNILTLKP